MDLYEPCEGTPHTVPVAAIEQPAATVDSTKRSADNHNQVYRRQEKVPKINGRGKIVVIKNNSRMRWRVHTRLLAQHSDYFLKALNSGFKESSILEFQLEESATRLAIDGVVEWLYGRSVSQGETLRKATCATWTRIKTYQAWLLADYLRIPELQNDLMHTLHHKRKSYQDSSSYLNSNNLPPLSQLHQFHCMILAARFASGKADINRDGCMADMSKDMVIQIAKYLAPRHECLVDKYPVESFLVEEHATVTGTNGDTSLSLAAE